MRYFIVVFLLVSILTLILGALILGYHETIARKKIIRDLIVKEDSVASLKQWKAIPTGYYITLKVFIFNYSNDSDKPEEVGPFIFSVFKTKKEVIFHDPDHVSFKEYSTFHLKSAKTSRQLQEVQTLEQLILTPIDGSVKMVEKSVRDILFGEDTGFFKNHSHSNITMNTGSSDAGLIRLIQSFDGSNVTASKATDGYQFPSVKPGSHLAYLDTISDVVVSLKFEEIKKENDTRFFKFVMKEEQDMSTTIGRPRRTLLHSNHSCTNFFMIEPLSGLVFSYRKEFMVSRDEMKVLRYEELLKPSKKTIQYFDTTVNYRLKVVQSCGGYSLIISCTLFLLTLFSLKRRTKQDGTVEFAMQPITKNTNDMQDHSK